MLYIKDNKLEWTEKFHKLEKDETPVWKGTPGWKALNVYEELPELEKMEEEYKNLLQDCIDTDDTLTQVEELLGEEGLPSDTFKFDFKMYLWKKIVELPKDDREAGKTIGKHTITKEDIEMAEGIFLGDWVYISPWVQYKKDKTNKKWEYKKKKKVSYGKKSYFRRNC
jgi:hypothetical protein